MFTIRIMTCTLLIASFFFMPGIGHTLNIESKSCMDTDIQAAINSANTGDVVIVPGTSCIWKGPVDIPNGKKIVLLGRGAKNTVITYSGGVFITMNESGARITGIAFISPSGGSYEIDVKGSGWRIDHCKFTNTGSGSDSAIVPNSTNIPYKRAVGLIDNNEFIDSRVGGAVYGIFPTTTKANDEWSVTTTPGSANTVYIEDNTFTRSTSGNVTDANYGGSYVFRYNTINAYGNNLQVHSIQGNNRGGKWWEIYGNINYTTINSWAVGPFYIRGGSGIVLFNKAYPAARWKENHIHLDNIRSYSSETISGKCDGRSSWDGNTGTAGYPCRDQIGRGNDATLWINDPSSAYTQVSMPAYFFANRDEYNAEITAALYNVSAHPELSTHIQANRDYYEFTAVFNGTSGVGCGPLTSLPDKCTKGVAYWVTDQSCTGDISNMVGRNPITPLSGTLYKCTAQNTWAKYFTPYTYPHPLRRPIPPTWK